MAEMYIDDLPSNTEKDRNKKERSRMKASVRRENIVRSKKTFAERFVDYFSSEDMFEEVVMPAIGNMLLDGIEIFFFRRNRWENGRRRYRRDDDYYDDRSRDYDYSARYKTRDYGRDDYYDDDRRDRRDRRRNEVDYRNIILRYREDAEKVVRDMRYRIKETDYATVSDLLDAIEAPSEYTDNNWGWTDPRDIDYRRVSSGYLIVVTEPRPVRS